MLFPEGTVSGVQCVTCGGIVPCFGDGRVRCVCGAVEAVSEGGHARMVAKGWAVLVEGWLPMGPGLDGYGSLRHESLALERVRIAGLLGVEAKASWLRR